MATTFPKLTLEKALALPNALQRNGGNPMTAIDLGTAIGVSPGSSAIRTLNAAASAYGLTGGTYKTTFTMRALGQAIVTPTSDEERVQSLVTAALTPALFRQIFDYYKGKKAPERTFLTNTLVREFKVPADQAETCAEIFLANLRFVGLMRQTASGDWIAHVPNATGTGSTAEPEVSATEDIGRDDGVGDGDVTPEQLDATPEGPPPLHDVKKRRPNKLFIGHGKNKKPLDQLTKVLRDLGIPYLVAEDEPNAGRPISRKVRDTMDQCGAAILIFSADIEYFDSNHDSVWRPSENVSHELGAAAVMYDDRIIMFKEDGVTLASNYSGIGYITFEKDRLDAKTNDLLRELVGLKILRLSVSDED